LKEWGADDFDNALFHGSEYIESVELLKNWINR